MYEMIKLCFKFYVLLFVSVPAMLEASCFRVVI